MLTRKPLQRLNESPGRMAPPPDPARAKRTYLSISTQHHSTAVLAAEAGEPVLVSSCPGLEADLGPQLLLSLWPRFSHMEDGIDFPEFREADLKLVT